MDGYLQSSLVVTPLASRSASTSSTVASSPSTGSKLLQPPPPTNKDFHCNELHTPDGVYPLLHEAHITTIHPQFTQGTHTVLVDATASHSNTANSHNSNNSGNSNNTLGIATTKTSSTTSSMSEHAFALSTVQEQENVHADSSEDESSQGGIYFGNPYGSKSAALPIPNASSRHHQQHQQYNSHTLSHTHTTTASRSIGASSSSSSAERSLPMTLRATPITTHGNHSNSNHSHSHSNNNQLVSSQGYSGSLTPTSSTPHINTSLSHDPLPNPGLSIESVREDVPSSAGGSSSVGSLSSLFSRNSLRHNHPRKPKNNLAKTKSSFVLRILIHDHLPKILASRTIEDAYMFFNMGLSFVWMDAHQKIKEPLSRIVFTRAYPTCHDVNILTRSAEHLDVIIGFSSGDLMWYDPISQKYVRLNKDGALHNAAATVVRWVPGSEDLFLVAFSDGIILVMDKDRDDQSFVLSPTTPWSYEQFEASKPNKSPKYNPVSHWRVSETTISDIVFSPGGSHVAIVGADKSLRIVDFNKERLTDIFGGYYGRFRCISWSPDGHYLLTGGEDDLVTIWAFPEQKIVARCQGHKSWVTAVAFDPWRCDGKVYRFGSVGEDCKLILWDFSYSTLHRPKHKSHAVSSPHSPRNHVYSPPQSPKGFRKIEHHYQPPSQRHTPVQPPSAALKRQSSTNTPTSTFSRFRRRSSRPTGLFSNGSAPNAVILDEDATDYKDTSNVSIATVHPILNKNQVPYLQPIMVQSVHADPCSDISFRKDSIVTTDRRGRIRTWGRPQG
ncbi:WD40-repeat-containing domain protein [Syncephalastrum racemosum]|uniref:WD40-repeat-containing domain protein n=1 Tax=Syncephalastrum racemosum TaxID=13706 RepID=A0A1X2HDJ4_SYNRA|nr:WD40-repeat-containing domain protein [Syncephalastrum racemosum]